MMKPNDNTMLPEQISLPDRQKGPQSIRPMRTEKVKTNCHVIKFTQPIALYHYEAKFFCVINDGVLKDLSQGMKTDVGNERRRNFLWELFKQILDHHREHFPVQPQEIVYDCGCMIVSAKKLPIGEEMKKLELVLDDLSEEARIYLPAKVNELYVEVKYVSSIKVDSHTLPDVATNPDTDRSLLQLLEIIYNQKIIEGNQFHVFPHKSFIKQTNQRNDIDGRVIKDGLSKGVRLCFDGATADKLGLLLQIEIVRSAFFPSGYLFDYLVKRFRCRDARDLENFIGNPRNLREASSELKKLTLVTSHLRKNIAFICDGIDNVPASNRTFEHDSSDGDATKKRKISVVDYFTDKYNIRFQYGGLPCAIRKIVKDGAPKLLYYPIDVLKIVDGQRVPINKMTPNFQDLMIRNTRMNPEQLERVTGSVLNVATLNQRNPYAQAFKIPLDPNAILTNADILPQPAIVFKDNIREEPGRDGNLFWRPPQNRKFLIPGQSKKWMVVNYNRCMDGRMLQDFVTSFVRNLRTRGAQINDRPEIFDENRWQKIREKATGAHVDFLLVVTKNKMDPIHNDMKHFEVASKIVTQHLWQQTVFDVVKKNRFITLENVVMKTNEKLGGTNFMVASSNSLNQSLIGQSSGALEKWISGNRLFIGLDLSHSGPANQGNKSIPSVIGMAYNVNEQLSMTGHYFFRESNKTIISNLTQELEIPILEFKNRSKSKQWPSHIFIYRSGVSEGEYTQVTQVEKLALINCLEGLANKYSDFKKPGFTFVIAQRNNGFKLTPTQAPQQNRNGKISDADRNLKPGTIVSKGVVNPTLEQFILIAHRTIQGTARPILYTVIADQDAGETGKRIPADELKYVTFALCHLHNNVLGTVNVPSVLYHAGQVAKRGRNNLKMDMFGTVDETSTQSSDKTRQKKPEESNYEDVLTKQLRVSLKNKYWA